MIQLPILYAVVFVVGPLLLLVLIMPAPSRRQFRGLIAVTVGCLGMSLAVRFGSTAWGEEHVRALLGMSMMWVAWISVLAFMVQRFRAIDQGPVMRRWSVIFGMMGTTVPWFGLASARLMAV